MSRIPLWTAIVPTYGEVGVALTTKCLESLRHTTERHEIIVVDDGSGGEVQEKLTSLCQQHSAKLVACSDNAGFARACNEGIKLSNGTIVILVNNDTLQINKTLDDLADQPCRQALLRSRQVHIGSGGWIMPGTCAGIVLGWADDRRSVGDCWRQLNADHADRPVLASLAGGGPVELAKLAGPHGFVPEGRYAGKCHLCWSVRRLLYFKGLYRQELGPAGIYESA